MELHSSYIVTRGKAGYSDTDISEFVDKVVGVCDCSFMMVSILSGKKEVR